VIVASKKLNNQARLISTWQSTVQHSTVQQRSVHFDAPVKERDKDNRVMLKALLGLIGWPGLEHSIQHRKGHNSNSRVGSHHEKDTLLSRGYNHG
jgi:hypothetical protein